jgi:hypothetical protein
MRIISLIALALLSGCGKLGYKSEYTAETSDIRADVAIAQEYYGTMANSLTTHSAVTFKLAETCETIARQIGDQALLGTAEGKEKTLQIQAVSTAVIRTADAARVPIAAPSGFVNQPVPTDFPLVMESLPNLTDMSDIKERVDAAFQDGLQD